MSVILDVQHATKKFGGLMANEDITFQVQAGEILGVVGPNGAGKTTLFNSLSNFHKLTSGAIYFEGRQIHHLQPYQGARLGIARTFQIPQAMGEMTVYENVLVAAMGKDKDAGEIEENTRLTIAMCGLASLTDKMAKSLNVMQKKRLEIARAIAIKPKLMLLDETMAGLTGVERSEAVNLVRRISQMGVTILMIEHVMEVVMNVSDRIMVLDAGKVLAVGTPEEISQNDEVIQAYLGGRKPKGEG